MDKKHGKKNTQVSEEKAERMMQSAFSEKYSARLPLDFNARVWDKIGEPSPSWHGRLMQTIMNPVFLKPAAGFAILLITALVAVKAVYVTKQGAQGSSQEMTAAVSSEKVKKQSVAFNKKEAAKEQTAAVNNIKEAVKENTEALPQSNSLPQTAEKPKSAPETFAVNNSEMPRAAVPVMAGVNTGSQASAASSKEKPVIVTPTIIAPELEIKGNVIKPLQNQAMVIKYRLDNAGEAVITIYDRTGRPVKRVIEKKDSAGVYSFTWRGEGDSGATLQDGIYVILIKTPLTEKRFKAAIIK